MNQHVERRRRKQEQKEREAHEHEERLKQMAEDTKRAKEEAQRRKREKGAKVSGRVPLSFFRSHVADCNTTVDWLLIFSFVLGAAPRISLVNRPVPKRRNWQLSSARKRGEKQGRGRMRVASA